MDSKRVSVALLALDDDVLGVYPPIFFFLGRGMGGNFAINKFLAITFNLSYAFWKITWKHMFRIDRNTRLSVGVRLWDAGEHFRKLGCSRRFRYLRSARAAILKILSLNFRSVGYILQSVKYPACRCTETISARLFSASICDRKRSAGVACVFFCLAASISASCWPAEKKVCASRSDWVARPLVQDQAIAFRFKGFRM